MANYNKNILIGIGGRENINHRHFWGQPMAWNGCQSKLVFKGME
jgi:hypothetical protein